MRGDKSARVFYFMSGEHHGEQSAGSWRPNADIYETEDLVVVALEVAGVKAEDVDITAWRDRLTVKGVRRPEMCSPPVRFHQIEIVCGEFEKEIVLASELRGAPVEAHLANGILSIRIQKHANVDSIVPKHVSIEAEQK
jgi:HSP20 family protein